MAQNLIEYLNKTIYENSTQIFTYRIVSRYYSDYVNYGPYTTFIFVVSFLGFIANLWAFVTILARRLYRQSSLFIYLGFIHCLDFIFTTWWGLLYHALPLLAGFSFTERIQRYDPLGATVFCGSLHVIKHASSMASAWVTVSANAIKLASLLFPFSIMSKDTTKVAFISSLIPVIVSFAIYIPAYKFLTTGEYKRSRFIVGNELLIAYDCVPDYSTYLAPQISLFAGMILYSFTPGILLIILSISILVVFWRNYQRHRKLMGEELGDGKQAEAKGSYEAAKNSIIMLLPLSMVHIICTLPVQTKQTLSRFGVTFMIPYYVLTRFQDINHGINVFVQLIVSKSYRDALLGLNKTKK